MDSPEKALKSYQIRDLEQYALLPQDAPTKPPASSPAPFHYPLDEVAAECSDMPSHSVRCTFRKSFVCGGCNTQFRNRKGSSERITCYVLLSKTSSIYCADCQLRFELPIIRQPKPLVTNQLVDLKSQIHKLQSEVRGLRFQVNKLTGTQYLVLPKQRTGPLSQQEREALSHLVTRAIQKDEVGSKVLYIQNAYNHKLQKLLCVPFNHNQATVTPQRLSQIVRELEQHISPCVWDHKVPHTR